MEQSEDAIRFSLRQMFGVTAAVALILSFVSHTGLAGLGIHLSFCLVGWIMCRIFRAHLGGVIPALLGADLLLMCAVNWSYGSEDFFGIREIISLLGSLLVVVGIGVLVWIGTKKRRFWKHQYATAGVVLLVLFAWWVAAPMIGNSAITQRRASDASANAQATAKAIALVEEVRQRTGTTPDEEALPGLLSEPLPSVRWDGISGRISYRRTGETSYELTYIDPSMFMGDIVTYDSAAPQKGWTRIPF